MLEPNVLTLTIQPDEQIALRFLVKYPFSSNQLYPVRMDFSYKEAFKTPSPDDYERILLDMVRGDLTLFVREDTIEEMWGVVDPINERWESNPPPDFPNYQAGTWGPPGRKRSCSRKAGLGSPRDGRAGHQHRRFRCTVLDIPDRC